MGFRRAIPNAITLVRLVAAGIFFGMLLAVGTVPVAERNSQGTVLVVIFVAVALTDILDGYLARRWGAESAFGRVMDPFCDKLLVLGSLVILAAEPFAPVSGIRPWMVVLVLARELLVTSIRAVAEREGISFPADVSGKIKMFLQCLAVSFAMFLPTHSWAAESPGWQAWRDSTVWAMVIGTALSALPYMVRGAALVGGKAGKR